jgi:hypothetical protein
MSGVREYMKDKGIPVRVLGLQDVDNIWHSRQPVPTVKPSLQVKIDRDVFDALCATIECLHHAVGEAEQERDKAHQDGVEYALALAQSARLTP